MPQEIALAHAGRIEFILPGGLYSPRANAGRGTEPKLVTLARASGLKPEHYASNHSLMPFFRMVARGDQPTRHGDPSETSLTRRLGTATPGKFVRICPQCVDDDLNHWHFSWYRRTHQLPGIDWCPVHRSALVAVDHPNPWNCPPHHWVDQEKIRQLQSSPEGIAESGFLGRVGEIACELLERPVPLPVGRVGAALTERVQQMGLRTCLNGAKPVLSDVVREIAPASWLNLHWVGLAEKRRGEKYLGLDQVVSRTRPATGLAYVTALAAMFDSASEALNYFTSATQKNGSKPNPGPTHSKIRPLGFWEGELWPVYERFEGNISDIARHLQMDRTYLAAKLQRYSLPSLKDCDRDPRWLALLGFQTGTSLSTACKQEGVDVESVEVLLRRTSPRVIELARTITQRRRTKAATGNVRTRAHDAHAVAGQSNQRGIDFNHSRGSGPDQASQAFSEMADSV